MARVTRSVESDEQLEDYDVVTSSGTSTTLKLNRSDAERMGLTGSDDEARKADDSGVQAASFVRPVENKARKAANK